MEKEKRNHKPEPANPEPETLEQKAARIRTELETRLRKFTGTAHTLVHRPHEGFADYAVASLELKDGVVVSTKISDPFAGFEAFAKLELANEKLLESLRKTYPSEFQHVV